MVAGVEQPGAGPACLDRDRDRPLAGRQNHPQKIAFARLDDEIVADCLARR